MAGPLAGLLDLPNLSDLTTPMLSMLPSPLPSHPSSSPSSSDEIQPPRPQNSWILYRAWKVKNLPPRAPGEPRRSQGEISSMVSNMWKYENAHIRGYFERLADEAKADHKTKYPGYRYRPQKKGDTKGKGKKKTTAKPKGKGKSSKKDSRRSSRGVSREADSPTGQHQQRPGHPYPMTSRPLQDFYDRVGPSPPLSAASTPSSSPSPLPPISSPELANALDSDGVVAGFATPSAIPPPPFSQLGPETDPFDVYDYYNPGALDDVPVPQWQPNDQVVAPAPSTVPEWEPSSASQSNALFFDVPGDQTGGWPSSEFHCGHLPHEHTLSCFVASLPPPASVENDLGDIEVSVGPVPSGSQPVDCQDFFHSDGGLPLYHDADQQFFPDDAALFDLNSIYPFAPENLAAGPQAPADVQTYVPPSGAAQSSSRRVGANWSQYLQDFDANNVQYEVSV